MAMFSEFTTADKNQWLQQVKKDLKGADIQPVIQWEFEKSLQAEALLTAEETAQYQYQQILATTNPAIVGQGWRNRTEIQVQNEATANKIALEALNNGVEEIAFILDKNLTENVNFAILLKEILLQYCAISFVIEGDEKLFITQYLYYVASQNIEKETLSGSITNKFVNQELSNITTVSANFKSLVLKPTVSTAEYSIQIADILHQLQRQVTAIQYTKGVLQNLQVELTIGNAYFVEIAKLRAMRLLLVQVADIFGCEMQPCDFEIHAKTTLQEGDNANKNLISNTIQAMAAITGGCNVLTITPHSQENLDFSYRIARNVSNLLREESHFDKVIDAANGSHYIEQLTDKIAEKAWEEYQKMLNQA